MLDVYVRTHINLCAVLIRHVLNMARTPVPYLSCTELNIALRLISILAVKTPLFLQYLPFIKVYTGIIQTAAKQRLLRR